MSEGKKIFWIVLFSFIGIAATLSVVFCNIKGKC